MINEEGMLLIETIQVLESLNLTELLPVTVIGWYETRKQEGEIETNYTPAEQFIQEQARKLS